MIILLKIIIIVAILGVSMWVVNKYFYEFVRVNGQSMYPTLKDGDVVLLKKHLKEKDMQAQKIYVYISPNKKLVIKRCISLIDIYNDLYIWFEGDNKDYSVDSRKYGGISFSLVQGKVVKIIPNKHNK
jgi:signal peptidase I